MTINELYDYGINGKADYWAHIFPIQNRPMVYIYDREDMFDLIRAGAGIQTVGRSKDGTITGFGLRVSKDCPLIRTVAIPNALALDYKWVGVSDRVIGRNGEHLFYRLLQEIPLAFLPSGLRMIERMESKTQQYDGIDFRTVDGLGNSLRWEIKTEALRNSRFLFIQTAERGHRVHALRSI